MTEQTETVDGSNEQQTNDKVEYESEPTDLLAEVLEKVDVSKFDRVVVNKDGEMIWFILNCHCAAVLYDRRDSPANSFNRFIDPETMEVREFDDAKDFDEESWRNYQNPTWAAKRVESLEEEIPYASSNTDYMYGAVQNRVDVHTQ